MKRAFAFALVLTALGATGAARADDPAIEEGRENFARGISLYRSGDYQGALAAFRRANAVAPSFRIQFNIGQTCAELSDYACAATAYGRYLAEAEQDAEHRATAERELARMKKLVAEVKISIDVTGAEIDVDDVHVGTSPLTQPVIVNPGRHRVAVTAPGRSAATRIVDVTAGGASELLFMLAETNGSSTTPPTGGPPPPPPTSPASEPPSRAPFWIALGVTGALAATTATFGILALGASSDVDAEAERYGAKPEEIEHAKSKVSTLAWVTNGFGAATIVGAVVTTVLWFSTKQGTKVGIGPSGISLGRTF
jgi:tetratricopeptide (TPR) repeat protein